MPPRLMFLRGFEADQGVIVATTFQKILGKEKVTTPDLKTRQTFFLILTGYILLLLVLIAASIVTWIYSKWYIAAIITSILIIVIILLNFLGGRGITSLMLSRAVKIAQQRYNEFKPQILVASSFGAIVLFQLDIPKLPVLLFSPAQDVYCRYMKSKTFPSFRSYPYGLIIHPSEDKTVPLEDSIRLVETSEQGYCKLDVIDDDHTFGTITEDQIKEMIQQVYDNGRRNMKKLKAEGGKISDGSHFDDSMSEHSIISTPAILSRSQSAVNQFEV